MYQRFHGASRGPNPGGKWQSIPRSGVTRVHHEEIDGWHLEINRRRVGSTIRREQYSVTMRRELPAHQEYLSGFSSKSAAIAAGRERIDLLRHIRPRPCRQPQRHGRSLR
jgi:hypothetical protein